MGSLLSTELNLQPRIINGRLTLNLHNQGLTCIPEEVFDVTDLEVLDVSNNGLASIPETIVRLQKLSRLDADYNLLTNLPHAIGSLQELTHLCINANIISTLPPGVEKLQRLTHLFIRSNQLTEFPPGACSLPSLEVLNVCDNMLSTFPPGVETLQKLRELHVQDNQLTELPPEVCLLLDLEVLSVTSNKLSTLPSGMCQLHNLREVYLWNNKFDTFPEVLCELPAMERLEIGNNSITRLPTALHRAEKLENLDVSDNPLTYPPQEVCEQGTGAIMAFLKEDAEKDVLQKLLQAFNRLSVKVKQTQWKPLARSLGFNNSEINDIKASAPDDVPDQVYQTLVQWREKEGEAATLSALEQHLRDLDFQQLADQLSRKHRTSDHREYETEVGAVGGQEAGNLQNRYPSVTFDRRFPIVEFERLEEQSILGCGGFAYVKKARHLDWRKDVAVKYLLTRKIEGSEQELLYSEARKLNLGSRSDHVISLLGVCMDPNFAIVMPYMENGSLAGLLRDVDVPWALRWRMAHETSLGMTFLHCQNPQILHCDLKAENVLLDKDFRVKISDFGLSKWRTKSRVVTTTSPVGGTITHLPPEYFLDINDVPTAEFDVYSFGVLLWEIITRADPYRNAVANSAHIRLAVMSGQRPDMTPVPTDLPDVDTVSQLMQTCWSQSPEDRPTFQECADHLRTVTSRFGKVNVLYAIIDVMKARNN